MSGRRSALTWLVVRRAVRGFGVDHGPDAAAGLTFYGVVAVVPALVATFSALALFGGDDDAARTVDAMAKAVLSSASYEAVSGALAELSGRSSAIWVLVASVAVSVWSVARYVAAFSRAMNRFYGVSEGRPLWRSKPTHLVLALVLMVLVVASVALAAVGSQAARDLGEIFGLGETALVLWQVLRWPVLLALIVLIIALLSYYAPNVAPPSFRWMSLGAFAAIVILALASAAFGAYVVYVADYGRLYGPFAGVLVFLLWLWIANMALLLGVELDVEIERARELADGVPAERQVQVPLRDARAVAAQERRALDEERKARRVRRRASQAAAARSRDRGSDD